MSSINKWRNRELENQQLVQSDAGSAGIQPTLLHSQAQELTLTPDRPTKAKDIICSVWYQLSYFNYVAIWRI